MDRRQFAMSLAALGLTEKAPGERARATERLQLSRNGWMPNNERLPVLVHRQAFSDSHVAEAMENAFRGNLWPPQWRNGVYNFHHYHSTAHEVLGFAGGSTRLMLGGEGGHELTVEAGDVLILPAGTGHCLLHAEQDFLVVGAYPSGQHWDICRSAPDTTAVERMKTLSFPKSDPVTGSDGDLVHAWKA